MSTIYTGIDIGTSSVKVVITEPTQGLESGLRIIGTGTAATRGMRHGYIVDTKEVSNSIKEALAAAERAAGRRVRSAWIAIGGMGLEELQSEGIATLTTSGGEVSERDIEHATKESERRVSGSLANRRVIHSIPLRYRIDGKEILGRPLGVRGSKLSIDTLLITAPDQHVQDIVEAIKATGIELEDIVASPMAASEVILNRAQKLAGVVLVNIGAETTSLIVFEDDVPISTKVFPNGSSDITNDIALSLKVPLTEAEQMKRGAITKTDVPRKKIDDVVAGRLKTIFTTIDSHLKSIGKQKMLPAGVVITGGGSGSSATRELAKTILKLPAEIGTLPQSARAISTDASWAIAFGLCRWGFSADQWEEYQGVGFFLSRIGRGILRGMRSLLP